MHYLMGVVAFSWMTIVYCVVFFPVTLPALLVFPWLMWGRSARRSPTPVRRSVWYPSLTIVIMFLWGTAFGQPLNGPWHGYQWPAAVGLGIFVVACVFAWREWRRSNWDRRVAGLLMIQMWFGAVGTFIVAGGVSAGSGLGAL